MNKRKNKGERQRRRVTVSVMMPCSAELIVERNGEDGDWMLVDLLRIDVSGSLTTVRENLDEDARDDMEAKANDAEDLA